MRTLLLLAALVLGSLPLAGCDGADSSGAGSEAPLLRPSTWRLVSSDGGAGPSTLRFSEEGGFSASVVCNTHFGTATFPEAVRGPIRLNVQGATRAYCGAEGSAYATRFARTFAAVRSYAVDGDALTLQGDGVRLRFEPMETVGL